MTTYHFAHAIDDHLMGTTHVIRGDEMAIICTITFTIV
ncbi:MAG: glutamate--tRNA ligase family protein [Clostridia bacterium]